MSHEHSPTQHGEGNEELRTQPVRPELDIPTNMHHQAGDGSFLEEENAIGAFQSIKLPPFWHDDPQSYFAMAELKFALHRVSSDASKFQHVASNFDAKLVSLCRDLIINPPVNNKYNTLKERILNALSPSQETNFRRLLHGHPLGNEKPTIYLQQLRNLAAGQCNNTLLRTLFLEQMPEDIRHILAIGTATTLDELATQADKMLEFTRPTINEMTLPSEMPSKGKKEDPLQVIIDRLDRLEAKFNRSRSRSMSRERSTSRGRLPSSSGECYYHRRFGDRAKKCQKPCSWNVSNKEQGN